jgi:alkane 1-monooxygenase
MNETVLSAKTFHMSPIKKYGWLLPAFVGIMPYIGHLIGWYWLTIVVFFLVLPILDHLIGEDPTNVPQEAEDQFEHSLYYRAILWLYFPIQVFILFWGYHQIIDGGLGFWENMGLALSVALVLSFGLNLGHELGHHTQIFDRIMAILMMSITCTTDFYIFHNFGHHQKVSTPEDPGSAKYGESFWQFWLRSVPGKSRLAWQIEAERLKKQGKPVLSVENRELWFVALALGWLVILTACFGFWAIPLFVLQYLMARTFLCAADYIEHYGLGRRKIGDTYEPVRIEHSWNNNYLISNLMLCQVDRHSDHHANPERPYQILRHLDEAPQLPSGYLPMIPIAMVPPLWRKIMHPRLERIYAEGKVVPNRLS